MVFTPELISLNNYQGQHKTLINMMIVILKQYIYATKCLNETLSFYAFVNKLSYWYEVEKTIAIRNNTYVKFLIKWKDVF